MNLKTPVSRNIPLSTNRNWSRSCRYADGLRIVTYLQRYPGYGAMVNRQTQAQAGYVDGRGAKCIQGAAISGAYPVIAVDVPDSS